MSILTAEQIDGVSDLLQETVYVEKWGGEVIVREPTALEWDRYERSLVRTRMVGKVSSIEENFDNQQARLVVKCLVDESGNRIFTDDQADILGKKSAAAIGFLFKVIKRLSGETEEARKELERNFTPGQSNSSTSD